MRVIKPLVSSYLARPYQYMDGHYYGVTIAVLANCTTDGVVLEQEQNLWKLFNEESVQVFGAETLDLCVPKHVPDLIVNGYAYGVYSKDNMTAVQVELNNINKILWVYGDRYWLDNRATKPKPFDRLPISWANAFGGGDYEYNRLGKGISTDDIVPTDKITQLPNVECPSKLIRRENERVKPVSFCALPIEYPGRNLLMGTYDNKWLEEDAPGFARDIDWTYFNLSPEDQRLSYLKPGDVVRFTNMHPAKKVLEITIPDLKPKVFFEKENQLGVLDELALDLKTIWAFPHREQLILIYQGNLAIPMVEPNEYFKHAVCAIEGVSTDRDSQYYLNILKLRTSPNTASLAATIDKHLVDTDAVGVRGLKLEGTHYLLKNRLRYLDDKLEGLFRKSNKIKIQNGQIEVGAQNELIAAKRKNRRSVLAEAGFATEFSGVIDDFEDAADDMQLELLIQKLVSNELDLSEISEYFLKNQKTDFLRGIERKRRKVIKDNKEFFQKKQSIKGGQINNPQKLDAFLKDASSVQDKGKLRGPVGDIVDFDKTRAEHEHLIKSSTADIPSSINFEEVNFIDVELVQQMDENPSDVTKVYRLMNQVLDRRSFKRSFYSLFLFDSCHFKQVEFSRKSFVLGKFNGCVFENCVFDDSQFKSIRFENCQFLNCTFIKFSNTGTYFIGNQFRECTLSSWLHEKMYIDNVTFEACNLYMVQFLRGYFEKLSFLSCKIKSCSFSFARISELSFLNSTIESLAILPKGMVKNFRIEGSKLEKFFIKQKSKIENFQVLNSIINHSSLRGIDIRNAVFFDAALEMNDLSKSNYESIKIKKSSFIGSMLIEISFNKSNVLKSNFTKTLLTGATFYQTVIRDVSFYMADLSRIGMDASTQLVDCYTKHANFIPRRKDDVN
ncbi:hypothetical protein AAEX37_01588 [Oligella sp. MSHR50489EDL]|uniref:DUF2169 family type VI secretion system accessory protein n=1 Tax=Oligella sp. MSHR50489EDL TaxID=3139409 RepID=UPI003D81B703